MPAKRRISEDTRAAIVSDFMSDMNHAAVGKKYGFDYFRTIRPIWAQEFGEAEIKNRHARLSRRSKLGTGNPMSGRTKTKHPRYKAVCYTNNGYRLVEAPDWFTGKLTKGKVLEHLLIACREAGITELPNGYVVHHKDEDKLNNCPSNLEIMTISDHMLLHAHLRYMKKVQRLSREGVESKCSRSAQEPETTGS